MQGNTPELSAVVLLTETLDTTWQQEFGNFSKLFLPHPELLGELLPGNELPKNNGCCPENAGTQEKGGEQEPKPACCPCPSGRQ